MIHELVTLATDDKGILRKRLEEVDLAKLPELQHNIQDMVDTMYAMDGLGLAANQIGLDHRIIVLRGTKNEAIVVVNPVLTTLGAKKVKSYGEGCLSCGTEVRRDIRRYRFVKIEGVDKNGMPVTLKPNNKMINIAIQHELDHLNGVLIIDR